MNKIDSNPILRSFLQDYLTLGTLQPNQKLRIGATLKGRQILEILADQASYYEQVRTVLTRLPLHKDFRKIIVHIQKANQYMGVYLSQLQETSIQDKIQANEIEKDLNQMRHALSQALLGIKELEKIYSQDPKISQDLQIIENDLVQLQSDDWLGAAQKALELASQNIKQQNLEKSILPLENWEVLYSSHPIECKKGNGNGPTTLERLYSVFNTARELLVGLFQNSRKEPLPANLNPLMSRVIQTIQSPGQQFSSSVLDSYLKFLMQNFGFSLISSFYLHPLTITQLTFEKITNTLKKELQEVTDFSKPICIPILIGQSSLIERRHVAVILIQDGELYYYDAKGIISKNRSLADGRSLRDVLDVCASLINCSDITENTEIHQFDIHSCGTFILSYLSNVLNKQAKPHEFHLNQKTAKELNQFRQVMIEDLKTFREYLQNEPDHIL